MARKDRDCCCVHGRQKPKDPKLSPMAVNAITRDGIQGLGCLVYINDKDLIVLILYLKSGSVIQNI